MSRFNAKISLTGRTHRVNISTAGDHIHLILLPVLLLLLHSLILILTHHTCLRLRMGKPGFLLKSHRRKRVSKPPIPLHSPPRSSPNDDSHSTDLLQSLSYNLGWKETLLHPPATTSPSGYKSGTAEVDPYFILSVRMGRGLGGRWVAWAISSYLNSCNI